MQSLLLLTTGKGSGCWMPEHRIAEGTEGICQRKSAGRARAPRSTKSCWWCLRSFFRSSTVSVWPASLTGTTWRKVLLMRPSCRSMAALHCQKLCCASHRGANCKGQGSNFPIQSLLPDSMHKTCPMICQPASLHERDYYLTSSWSSSTSSSGSRSCPSSAGGAVPRDMRRRLSRACAPATPHHPLCRRTALHRTQEPCCCSQ